MLIGPGGVIITWVLNEIDASPRFFLPRKRFKPLNDNTKGTKAGSSFGRHFTIVERIFKSTSKNPISGYCSTWLFISREIETG